MAAAFELGKWSDFFVAQTGATAALVGLVIVAISINLKEIIKERLLSGRALETVVMLAGVLILSTLALVPGQGTVMLGWEMFALGLVLAATHGTILVRVRHVHHESEARWLRVLLASGSIIPPILCGLSLLAGPGGWLAGGIYWLVLAVIFGLVGGLINSWILLVEILR
jgi:CDP-diglyceride synthetase